MEYGGFGLAEKKRKERKKWINNSKIPVSSPHVHLCVLCVPLRPKQIPAIPTPAGLGQVKREKD
jgi:hypothetical protein